jgi:hypothetical protein
MFDFNNIKDYFPKSEDNKNDDNKMVQLIKRHIYEAEKDEVVLLVKKKYAKEVCKILNKEDDRDKFFYQIIEINDDVE